MRAREVNEQNFERGQDPKKVMGIGKWPAEIKKMQKKLSNFDFSGSPDDILERVLRKDGLATRDKDGERKENMYDGEKLGNMAIEEGANDLWYESGSFFPEQLVRPLKISAEILKGPRRGPYSSSYEHTFKVKYEIVWSAHKYEIGKTKNKGFFSYKFRRVDDEIYKKINKAIKTANELKQIIGFKG